MVNAGLVSITVNQRASGISLAFLEKWKSLKDGELELDLKNNRKQRGV